MKRFGIFIVATLFLFSGCKMTVSLSGGNVDPRAKTVSIATFPNNSTLINPTLSQEFTNALKDMIQGQTPLTIVNGGRADYSIEGEIINYTVSPVAIQGDDRAAMNRLTITVNVRFTDGFDENKNFEQTFSRYADYSSTANFSAVEGSLVTSINEALTDDIFNKAFVNW